MSSTGISFDGVWLLFHTGRSQGRIMVEVMVDVVVSVVVVVWGGLVKTTRRLADISTPAMTIAAAMTR